MTVELNHTIVHATDPARSAGIVGDILGITPHGKWGPFIPLVVDHGTALDFAADPGSFTTQHYAFLVSDDVFDHALERLAAHQIPIWADPHRTRPDAVNHNDGGRGVYFEDADGHLFELITVPYGGIRAAS